MNVFFFVYTYTNETAAYSEQHWKEQYAYIQQLSTCLIVINEMNVAFTLFYVFFSIRLIHKAAMKQSYLFDKYSTVATLMSLFKTLIQNKKLSTGYKLTKDLP